MAELHKPRVAILASGDGTTAEAYARAIHERRVDAEIGLVITNKESAGILEKVDRWNGEWGFDTKPIVINRHLYPGGPQERGQTEEEAEAICTALEMDRTDLVAQLGYMVVGNDPYISEWGFIPERHTSPYQARALGAHPGWLPLTTDSRRDGASQLMLEAYHRGEIEEAAHTLHCVALEVDAGPVVAVHPIPIEPDDTKETLFERVQLVEKAVIAYAIDSFMKRQGEYQNANS